tara:strand:+ start:1709 stop:2629 length:921 start_codon:yes stop_codon:yes gene_type:complete
MGSTAKKIALSGVISLLLIGGIWYFLITSYTPELTTENEIELSDSQAELTNQSNDLLFQASFSYGQDNLEWSKISMTIVYDNTEFDCTKSGLTSDLTYDSSVQSKLNADGGSFTVEVNADTEDFVMLKFDNMQQTNDSDYDMKFSKTDIFLGENVTGIALDEDFEDVNSIPSIEFDENSETRLEWYDYDLSVHRVIPKSLTYVVNDSNVFYKLQFISYYNSEDESRFISFIISNIGDGEFPATNNENLIKTAPCLISSTNQSIWQHNETISVSENGIDICDNSCSISVEIRYLNQIIEGMKEIELQ